jgi:hypothetical protein
VLDVLQLADDPTTGNSSKGKKRKAGSAAAAAPTATAGGASSSGSSSANGRTCLVALQYFWRFGQIFFGSDLNPETSLKYKAEIFLQKNLCLDGEYHVKGGEVLKDQGRILPGDGVEEPGF